MSLKIQKPLRKSTNILFFLRSLRGRGGLYLRGEFALIRFVCAKNVNAVCFFIVYLSERLAIELV